MTIVKNIDGNIASVAPNGMLDTANSPILENELDQILSTCKVLKLDFSNVDYISSSGLRVLLKAQKKILAENGEMTISNVCNSVKEVFEITGFIEILTIV